MVKGVVWFWNVEEELESKVGTDEHPLLQLESAIQRSLKKKKKREEEIKILLGVYVNGIVETYAEPVSRITL